MSASIGKDDLRSRLKVINDLSSQRTSSKIDLANKAYSKYLHPCIYRVLLLVILISIFLNFSHDYCQPNIWAVESTIPPKTIKPQGGKNMVSVKGVTASQAKSYYERRDDYYSKEGHGEIYGKGAELLGISGTADGELFEKLLLGQSPSGEQLIQYAPNGEHRGALDTTYSAPKSISLLATQDERLIDAHKRAVHEVLNYAEKNIVQARETIGGITEKVNTGNLVAVLFQHNLSRELDPQVHTHCVILNMTQREDCAWRAISNEQFFDRKIELGQVYRNALAKIITQDLGYAITSDNKGLFEIKGIDKEVLDAFSGRSPQIEVKVSKLRELYPNANEQKLREWATLDSRQAKKDVDIETVQQDWSDRLHNLGYTKEALVDAAKKAAEKSFSNTLDANEAIKKAAEILTSQESVFTQGQLLKEAGKLSIGKEDFSSLEKALDQSINDANIIKLSGQNLTTMEMLKIESHIVEQVRNGQNKLSPIIDEKSVHALIQEKENELIANGYVSLKSDQIEAIKHILTSTDVYIAIQGDAGTGKTFAVGIAKEVAGDNTAIRGLTYTGKAASELESVGIPSSTLHSFLGTSNIAAGIVHDKETWIVDESSMVGSRQLDALLSKANETGSRVVLIGDHKQLQSLDAGNMFQQLQTRGIIKTVVMDDVIRQSNNPEYLRLVKSFSSKLIDEAFSRLEDGKITEIQDRAERLNTVTNDYIKGEHLSKILVVTRNTDRNELNGLIREELKSQDKLTAQDYSFTVRESKNLNAVDKHFARSYREGDIVFAQRAGIIGRAGTEGKIISVDHDSNSITTEKKDGSIHNINLIKDGDKISAYTEKSQSFTTGDKIVFLKNDKMLGVSNGSTGIIRNIDGEGNISAELNGNIEISFNTNHYPYLDAGYAITDYKSQGQTAKEVIVYTDTARSGSNYNSFYVSLSRGKDDLHVYTDDSSTLKEQVKIEQIKSSTLDHDHEIITDHPSGSLHLTGHSNQLSQSKESMSEVSKSCRQVEME
jgi:conjugative relaxase-like TrwC/TraI family protein